MQRLIILSKPNKHRERLERLKRIEFETDYNQEIESQSLMGIRSTMLVMTDSGLKRVSKFFIRAQDSKFGTRIEKATRKPRNPRAVSMK